MGTFYNLKKKNKNASIFFNGPFDKGTLKKYIAWVLFKCGEKTTLDFLENLKLFGFSKATEAGISLGIDDLNIPSAKKEHLLQTNALMQTSDQAALSGNITSIEKSQKILDLWNDTSDFIRDSVIENFKKKNPINSLSMMTFSGARGNISQARQLVGMRGLMADPQGTIVEFPIQSNFREGITLTEYLISCYGARKGLVDTALRTATSGYLTRRLVEAAQHLVISIVDCYTDAGLLIKNPKNEMRLIGRFLATNLKKDIFQEEKIINFFPYFFSKNKIHLKKSKSLVQKNQIISLTIARQLVKKKKDIYIRSPLTCQTFKSVCQFCYGWDLAKGDLITIGDAIGIIAAQSIGEPGTQLTMRTFHTGGVGVFFTESLETYNAPFAGFINFPEKLTGNFIRTPHGKIVYMIKYTTTNTNRVLLEIKSPNDNKISFSLQEAHLPPGSILYVRQGEWITKNSIIAQTSQVQTTKQKLPESLHPIQSKIDGEIQFENLTLYGVPQKFNYLVIRGIPPKAEYAHWGIFNVPTTNFSYTIGNFWVFSLNHHREAYSIKSFTQRGDLLSLKSPLYQVNFHIPFCANVKQIKSHIFFEKLAFSLPFNLIRFHKNNYSSSFYGTKKIILFWNSQRVSKKNTLNFFWYSKIWSISNLNYIYISVKYFKKNIEHLYQASPKNQAKSLSFGTLYFLISSFHLLSNSLSINTEYLIFIAKNLSFSHKFLEKLNIFCVITMPHFFLNGGVLKIQDLPIKNLKYSLTAKSEIFRKKQTIKLWSNYKVSYIYKYIFKIQAHTSSFVSYSLNNIIEDHIIKKKLKNNLIYYKKGWIFFSFKNEKNFYFSNFNKNLKKFLLFSNKNIKNIIFENQAIAVEYFSTKKFYNLKSKYKKNLNNRIYKNFYNTKKLLNPTINWNITNSLHYIVNFEKTLNKQIDTAIIFYKLKNIKLGIRSILKRKYPLYRKKKNDASFCICVIEKAFQKTLPSNLSFQKNWTSFFYKKSVFKNIEKINSPSLLKQQMSLYSPEINSFSFLEEQMSLYSPNIKPPSLLEEQIPLITPIKKNFKIKFNIRTGWQFSRNILNFQLNLTTSQKWYTTFLPEFYQFQKLQKNKKVKIFKTEKFNLFYYSAFSNIPFSLNSKNLVFQTYNNEWVFPMTKIATGFKMSELSGELIRYTQLMNQTYWSNFKSNDIITISITTPTNLKLGQIFRWGQTISTNILSPINGKLIKINKNSCSIRYGLPFLVAKDGIIHVSNDEIILKNQLLLTLKSQKLQTRDIVQGIPKIEQLFEARISQKIENSVNVPGKLQFQFLKILRFFIEKDTNPFKEESKNIFKFDYAHKKAIFKIQQILLFHLTEAYLNQGVYISEKHFEIIIREMTTRVRILVSGDSGYFPGEFIHIKTLKKTNKNLITAKKKPIIYEPIVLGITKSVLYAESFLLAASFQEVHRVLTRNALENKTDFLLGLHENVIVGQMIPAGSHIFSKISFFQNNQAFLQFKKKFPLQTYLKEKQKEIKTRNSQFKFKKKTNID
uniref:DNA-directed RNA polymerase n=1 Tax=Prototheca cutis TaxID=575411 RepID=A0A2Z6BEN9_9CHLO|nr:beta subunit of rna polymerase [Prototheca cutis]BBD20196.1 beta subunit of rna polymerase [Prototheca cutis]